MDLTLIRKCFTQSSTIGELYIDGAFECYTLEDVVREYPNKIKKETAVWKGKYKVILDFSNRFQKIMPHVLDVPLFEGIRIHSGNTNADTEGCILVGIVKGNNAVYQSRIAFSRLLPKLQKAINSKEEINLTIKEEK